MRGFHVRIIMDVLSRKTCLCLEVGLILYTGRQSAFSLIAALGGCRPYRRIVVRFHCFVVYNNHHPCIPNT